MKFCGFRIPEGMIADMKYINHQTGLSKSAMVRQGLMLVINDFFQKEKIKQEQIKESNRRRARIQTGEGMTLPDGW